jgi:protein-disulfide isomerase
MFTRFTTALLVCLPLLFLPAGIFGADGNSGNDPAIAEINGKTIHLSDLEHQFSTSLFQARSAYYDTERKVLDQFVDQYLLDEQARKENLTVAQLLEKHVDSTIAPDPSEDALRVYYEGVDSTESYEALRPKIVKAIHDRRIARAKATYLAALHANAKVTLHLAPPRAALSMTEAPTRGPADAPITLLEYADYECPYCQQIQPAVDKLEQEYKGKIAFVYKDFPLPMHPNAQKAAEASQCARKQGKYWEYHDLLEKTKQLDLGSLKAHAQTLQLDTAAFDKCLANGEAVDVVKATASEADKLELQGTPTFFVNGRAVNGTVSYDRLRGVIEEELSASQAAGARGASREQDSPKQREPRP